MIGAPGSGKSMMAKRLPSILPPLSLAESLETTQIHSVAGKLPAGTSLISQRPFRSPHHTMSQVAMTGGGSRALPGEVSMAHNGVLFLDELPEFNKSTLEVLRQPLEDRKITISRSKYTVEYPCSLMFVASMNPCPCGYYGDPTHHCVCTPGQIQRYMNKISGPLLDRIDIHCEVAVVPFKQLSQMEPGEASAVIRERVIKARHIQERRYKDFKGIHCNAQMTERMIHQYAEPDVASLDMLRMAMERLKLSARAYNRILKVARTIADLDHSEKVLSQHIAEAIGYRNLDRGDWAELFRCHDAQYHIIGFTHGLGTNTRKIMNAFVNIVVHNSFILRRSMYTTTRCSLLDFRIGILRIQNLNNLLPRFLSPFFVYSDENNA